MARLACGVTQHPAATPGVLVTRASTGRGSVVPSTGRSRPVAAWGGRGPRCLMGAVDRRQQHVDHEVERLRGDLAALAAEVEQLARLVRVHGEVPSVSCGRPVAPGAPTVSHVEACPRTGSHAQPSTAGCTHRPERHPMERQRWRMPVPEGWAGAPAVSPERPPGPVDISVPSPPCSRYAPCAAARLCWEPAAGSRI
jgi:hypothetical protein